MVSIGTFTLPDNTTWFETRIDRVEERYRRVVQVESVLTRFASQESFQSSIDELQRQIERLDRQEAALSVAPGRSIRGQRRRCHLQRDTEKCIAVLSLEVLGVDRFEYGSLQLHSQELASSPMNLLANASGNWTALPRIQISPSGEVQYPHLFDGQNQMTVFLTLSALDVLVLDSANRTVTLNGTNVLRDTQGEFVEMIPGQANLHYSDAGGSRSGTAHIFWEDRWV